LWVIIIPLAAFIISAGPENCGTKINEVLFPALTLRAALVGSLIALPGNHTA
jgi:hypothetical protein